MMDSRAWMGRIIELVGSRSSSSSSSSSSSLVIDERIWGSVISWQLYGNHPRFLIAAFFDCTRANERPYAALMMPIISYASMIGRLYIFLSFFPLLIASQ